MNPKHKAELQKREAEVFYGPASSTLMSVQHDTFVLQLIYCTVGDSKVTTRN